MLRGLPSLPEPPREFRGLWVATVYNLDWPSRPGLSVPEMTREADRILDRAAELQLNAIFLQVRAAGDALYPGSREPWSAALSGLRGRGPPEGFDPLSYWLAGARRRGILLFAWINPFRVGLPGTANPEPAALPPPELVRTIGKGYRWLDPGLPAARSYVTELALELARRYPVDGIVLDDYLYPYASLLGAGSDFPDEEPYADYRAAGGGLDRREWRVANGTAFMREFSRRLREEFPGLILGISPFGIYRSGAPEGIRGLSGRDETGLDALAWAAEGLVDFVSPQLYWPSTALEQSYPLLLAWWREALGQSGVGSWSPALWPSLAPGGQRIGPELRAHEALSELMIARAILGRGRGFALYSARLLTAEDNSLATALQPALGVRSLPGELSAGKALPGILSAQLLQREAGFELKLGLSEDARFLVVYAFRAGSRGGSWTVSLHPAGESILLPPETGGGRLQALALQAADARGRLSLPLSLDLRLP